MTCVKNAQKWSLLIKKGSIANLSNEIEESILKSSESYEKYLHKLILYLAQFCGQPSNVGQRKEAWLLTDAIYRNVKSVPTNAQHLGSLYHILKYFLQDGQLHHEAKSICDKHLSSADYASFSDKYLSVAYIWFNAAKALLESICADYDENKVELLRLCIEQDCDILKSACPSYVKYIINRWTVYFEKLEASSSPKLSTLRKSILSILANQKLSLSKAVDATEQGEIYKILIDKMTKSAIHCALRKNDIPAVNDLLDELEPVLVSIARKVEHYKDCCKLYFQLWRTLTRPFETLDKNVGRDISRYVESMSKMLATGGAEDPVMTNSWSLSLCFDSLSSKWSSELKNCQDFDNFKHFFTSFISLARFVQQCQKTKKIKSCCSENCQMKEDLYNPAVIDLRVLGVASRLFESKMYEDVFLQCEEMILDAVSTAYALKEKMCSQWAVIWRSLKTYIIRFAEFRAQDQLDKCVDLYSILCSAVAHLEEFDWRSSEPESIINSLRRLAFIYLTRNDYEQAILTACFGCLFASLSSKSTVEGGKIFLLWKRLKRGCQQELRDVPLLTFVRKNVKKIHDLGLKIELKDVDAKLVCLAEIEALYQAKTDHTKAISENLREIEMCPNHESQYVLGVQQLGFHVASMQKPTMDLKEFLRKAREKLKTLQKEGMKSNKALGLEANLDFFAFIDALNDNKRKTQDERTNILPLLRADTKESTENDDAVSTFAMINVKEDSRLMKIFKNAADKWKTYRKNQEDEIVDERQTGLSLKIMLCAGEYAGLHGFHYYETLIYKIAYKLAGTLDDKRVCIDVAGRYISSRYVNEEVIKKAHNYVESLKASQDKEDIAIIGLFWMELAILNFKRNNCKEATRLLTEVEKLDEWNIYHQPIGHLKWLGTTIDHYKTVKKDARHADYSYDVVCILYSLLSLYDAMDSPKCDIKEGPALCSSVSCDILCRISSNVNSLLGYREISSYLLKQLVIVQNSCSTVRVGAILKELCAIDLLRDQLEDCEVKLSGLEFILDLDATMKVESRSQPKQQIPKIRNVKAKPCNGNIDRQNVPICPIRDAGLYSDAGLNSWDDENRTSMSPILKKKMISQPIFVQHDANCICYKCQNCIYQNLVFNAIYMRAKMYAKKNDPNEAAQYFHNANVFRGKMVDKELAYLDKRNEATEGRSFWLSPGALADFVNFLIDFSHFVGNFGKRDAAFQLAAEAVAICQEYSMESQAIYYTANEYLVEFSESAIEKLQGFYPEFTMPLMEDVDVDDHAIQPINKENIKTPVAKIVRNRVALKGNVRKLEGSDGRINESKRPTKKALQTLLEMKSPPLEEENSKKEAVKSCPDIGELKSRRILSGIQNQLEKEAREKIEKGASKRCKADGNVATSSSKNALARKEETKMNVKTESDKELKETTKLMNALLINDKAPESRISTESQVIRRSTRNVTRRK